MLLSKIFKIRCCLCGEPTTNACWAAQDKANSFTLPESTGIEENLELCQSCKSALPWLNSYCRHCATPLPIGQRCCGACLSKTSANLISMVIPFHYSFPINQFIMGLKFGNNLAHARLLGQLLADYLYKNRPNDLAKPEVIIPVPLHTGRLKIRGYNQALELSKPIAQALKLPIERFATTRIRSTEAQAKQQASKRWENVRGSFLSNSLSQYKHIAIVDDVLTTGSTIRALIEALKKRHPLECIEVWCCAKA